MSAAMRTGLSYVLRSKKGTAVLAFNEEDTAKAAAKRQLDVHGVELVIFRQIITEEEVAWR